MGLSCRSKLKRWIRIACSSIWCHQVRLLPLLDLSLCHVRQLPQHPLAQFAFPPFLHLMSHWVWPVQRSHWQLCPQVSLKPPKSFLIVDSEIILLFGLARAYWFVSFLLFWYVLLQPRLANSEISWHCQLRVLASCYLAGNDSITITITADFQCWFLNTSQTAIALNACELFGFGLGSFSDVATGWENTASFFFISFWSPSTVRINTWQVLQSGPQTRWFHGWWRQIPISWCMLTKLPTTPRRSFAWPRWRARLAKARASPSWAWLITIFLPSWRHWSSCLLLSSHILYLIYSCKYLHVCRRALATLWHFATQLLPNPEWMFWNQKLWVRMWTAHTCDTAWWEMLCLEIWSTFWVGIFSEFCGRPVHFFTLNWVHAVVQLQ